MSFTKQPFVKTAEACAAALVQRIKDYGSCVIAFSGGVDSTVVAAAAKRACGEHAVAVTAVSPSLSRNMYTLSQQMAREIGIEHILLETQEITNGAYARNDSQRCYFCKQELYNQLHEFARARGLETLVSGTNADDLSDYRPGLRAATEHEVQSPLAELGIGKSTVREIARFWSLSISEEPAAPCLASRLAYGEPVTEEKLRRIDAAEDFLRAMGFLENRVRFHPGDLARIEVPRDRLAELSTDNQFREIAAKFKSLGFKFVTVDLEGLRSGNLNQLVSINLSASSLAGSTKR